MANPKPVLIKLTQNLNILREREAKYGGNAPLELVNQIADHEQGIALTNQVIAGELSQAEWQETMKPLLVAIDIQSGEAISSVTIGDIQGGIFGSEIAGHDISIGQKIVNIFTGDTSQPDQRNRQIMLKLVKEFWVKGVLENSLHNAMLIELGMKEHKEAVAYPWEMVLQSPHQPNCTIPPDTRMIDVFDQYQTLLILGEPGSGKTTMLLELARQTISRAETDLTQPMPVVFNLSSWSERQLPLAEWLVEELNTKYNIPKKVAQPWVNNDALLLLLDGLDEVAHSHRAACVEEINTFRKSSLMPVVVCSRIADYERLSARLNLAQALVLQPLAPEQVDEYLVRLGMEFSGLRRGLQQDLNLLELAQSPLMLSVMTLAYKDIPTEELPQLNSLEVQRRRLFEVYVQRMFERRGDYQRFSQVKTIHWLVWLAQKMSQHAQTVFLIERIQPGWLDTDAERRLYPILTGLITMLIFGLIAGPLLGVWMGLHEGLIVGIRTGVLFGLIVGIFSGLYFGRFTRRNMQITPIEALNWSWKKLREGLIAGLGFVIFLGLIIGLIVALVSGLNTWMSRGLITGLVVGLRNGLMAGLFCTLVSWLLGGLTTVVTFGLKGKMKIEADVFRNHDIWQSAKNAIIGGGLVVGVYSGLIIGLAYGLLTGFMEGLSEGVVAGVGMGLFFWLIFGVGSGLVSYGGLPFIQHFIIRFYLYRHNYIPWHYTRFLDYCADRIFLRKVGGGYIFIHRYLMEYFASLEQECEGRLSR